MRQNPIRKEFHRLHVESQIRSVRSVISRKRKAKSKKKNVRTHQGKDVFVSCHIFGNVLSGRKVDNVRERNYSIEVASSDLPNIVLSPARKLAGHCLKKKKEKKEEVYYIGFSTHRVGQGGTNR
jgi:hypothetical protein